MLFKSRGYMYCILINDVENYMYIISFVVYLFNKRNYLNLDSSLLVITACIGTKCKCKYLDL